MSEEKQKMEEKVEEKKEVKIRAKEVITKRISSIRYNVLSPKEIIKQSVLKIITPELYDRYGFPVEGGLMDLKMGVLEPGLRCRTCGESYKNCEGHFGYIELVRPILNVLYIDKISQILKAISPINSRVKCSDEQRDKWIKELRKIREKKGIDEYQKAHSKIMSQLAKVKVCPHSQEKVEEIKLDKSSVYVFTTENKKRFLTTEIRFLFENIIEEDLEILGIIGIRPEWLILTQMPIPPVSMRSTITLQSGQRSEDDMTHKLTDIIRTNQRLQEHLLVGVPEAIVEDVWDLLQYHISTYFDNNIPGLPPARHRSGEPIKAISERIKGKKGLIRNNLIGKRVNFSARTVISPDPRVKLNEVGVPFEIAKKLTIPEKVTKFNINFLKELIKNGPDKYPGANYVRTKTGARKIIIDENIDFICDELDIGYEVDRHLLDGDSVIFNRQPSLHKLSMMGHKVRVLPVKTFTINPGVCEPYNADFDGDEMNLHMPQNIESRFEVENLMDVKNQLVSPASGDSVIGCIQDAITGLYILTNGEKYSKEDALELLFSINFTDIDRINFKDMVDGKEIVSVLFKEDLDFIGESKNGKVVIQNGKLIEGVIDKKTIGSGGGTLLRHIHKNYGGDVLLEFSSYLSNLGIQVLKKRGFSMSMEDFDISLKVKKEVDKINNNVLKDVEKLIEDYKSEKLKRITGLSLSQTFEINVLTLLNSIRDKCMKIVSEELDENSGTMLMVNSGSMGKVLSVVQMHTGVGQQSIRGERINRGFSKRTLSHFKKGTLSPFSKGYIQSALRNGLKPEELFFYSITGRDGLTDTALKTPKTGYLYRRMAASMLDLIVKEDLSVRDDKGTVIQFKYGVDGIDVSKTVSGRFDIKSIIKQTLNKNQNKKVGGKK